jgi:hypothetical protein
LPRPECRMVFTAQQLSFIGVWQILRVGQKHQHSQKFWPLCAVTQDNQATSWHFVWQEVSHPPR